MKKLSTTLNCLLIAFILSAQAPSITSFSPTSGPIGALVTINGSNFSTTAADNIVYFGAVKATVINATATSLIVSVPVGTTYEPISVAVNNRIAYSAIPFTVDYGGGAFTFTAASFAPVQNFTYDKNIISGDFDGDGKVDLANAHFNFDRVAILRNTTANDVLSFVPAGIGGCVNPIALAAGDIDADGKLDLVVINPTFNTIYVLKNNSTPGSISFSHVTQLALPASARRVAVGDIDNDGRTDVVSANSDNNTISVFRNTTTGTTVSFAARVDFACVAAPEAIAIGDINADGKAEIGISGYSASGGISLFRNNSTPGTISLARTDYGTAAGFSSDVDIKDLDGDGKPDMISSDQGILSVYRNTTAVPATISFAARQQFTAYGNTSLALADLNADGKADAVTSSSYGGWDFAASVHRNTSTPGNISFAPYFNYAAGSYPYYSVLADMNGDGRTDIITGNGPSINQYSISYLKNQVPISIQGANCPEQLQPVNNATSVMYGMPALFKWKTSLNANGYRLKITPQGGSTSEFFTLDTFYHFTPQAATNYTWSVEPMNPNTGISCGNFSFSTCPAAPASLYIYPPGSNQVCEADSLKLLSSASGVQWFFNGVAIPGATADTLWAKSAGSYTTRKVIGDCYSDVSATTTITHKVSPSKPVLTVTTGATPICPGETFSMSVPTTPLTTYAWIRNGQIISGAMSNNYFTTTPGTYIARVGNTVGCFNYSDPATVSNIPVTPFSVTAASPGWLCPNDSVKLHSSLASGNQWYRNSVLIPGATEQDYYAKSTGTYTVRIVENGCNNSAGTSVSAGPSTPTPAITVTGSTTFCSGGSVKLTSTSTFTNQWYKDGVKIPNATNSDYFATETGNYTVVATMVCASSASAPVAVTVKPSPPQPVITVTQVVFCTGDSMLLHSSSSSDNQWYKDGTGLIPGATGQDYYAKEGGGYYVVVNWNGCSKTSATRYIFDIPKPATPVITVTGATSFCAGDSVLLQSPEIWGNHWYKDGVLISGNQEYYAKETGVYKLVVSGGCPSDTSVGVSVTVNSTPKPLITVAGNTSICTGDSVKLQSSATSGNQWYKDGNIISGATGDAYYAKETGSFTVIATQNGCSSAMSLATNVVVNTKPAVPVVTVTGNTTFCAGDSVKLQSSAAPGNQWYRDGNPIGSATADVYYAKESGSYTVVITQNGCSSEASIAAAITVNAIPAKPAVTVTGSATFCAGDSVKLQSSAASGNQWYKDGNAIGSATADVYYAKESGSYTVVTTQNGCSSEASIAAAITVNAIPAAPVVSITGNTIFCAGDSVKLQSSVASGNQWYKDGNAVNSATGDVYYAKEAGSFTVTTTQNGCSSSASIAIVTSINPLPATPVITVTGSITFCAGDSVKLQSSAISGNQWYKDGNLISGATGDVYYAKQQGVFTTRVTDVCVSAPATGITVTVTPLPSTPSITPNGSLLFCAGDSIRLQSSAVAGNQWLKNGTVINGATAQDYYAKETGAYTIRVTQNNCVSAESNTVTITVTPPVPQPVITANGNTLSATPGYSTYAWFLDNVLIPGAAGPQHIASQSGVYKVEVTDINGCRSSSVNFSLVITSVNNVVVQGYTVTIFPNPVREDLTIRVTPGQGASGSIQLGIADANGRVLKQQVLKNGYNTINFRAYKQGVYWVIIRTSKSEKTVKILKIN